MPLLFYAPWAIFCTTSAYFADRYSKTTAIVIWKFSEIIISILLRWGSSSGQNMTWTPASGWCSPWFS